MSTRFPGFPTETLEFLQSLEKNNNRDWFNARKPVYEQSVKAPMIALVEALGEQVEAMAPNFETNPTKAIYRIYRDVRFSNDKRPYKTHVSALFRHKKLPKHAGAGFYFHFSAKELFVGGGVYMPGSKELLAIRKQISADPGELRKILKAAAFRRAFGEIQGEKLKRIPKGFSPDDPAADLLVYKQFLASDQLAPQLVESPKLQQELLKRFRAMAPLVEYLNRPLVR